MKRSRLSASTSEDEDPEHPSPYSAKRPAPHWREQDPATDSLQSMPMLQGSFRSEDSDSDAPSSYNARDQGASGAHQARMSSGSSLLVAPKIKNQDKGNYVDSKAEKMMAKMGYKSGTGLGKHSQGRVAPIELSTQRGRRGLGLHLEGLEPADIEWDPTREVVQVVEEVQWLTTEEDPTFTSEQLSGWMREVEGFKKSLDNETHFVDPDVLRNVLSSKSVFDRLDKHELTKARSRSNPFETIGKGIFLNRAAMKMANMDAVFDFMFTNPKHLPRPGDPNQRSMVGPQELLYFADVCAGPGGFSEYVLWRYGWEARGFGMTLKDSNDFKLEDFFAAPSDTFEPYYGTKENGNVYDPENIDSFRHHIMTNTGGKGVHFMMADGGFSVEGQENIQEILSKQLYLCQCLFALNILRVGGHFVVKLFDLFTPFSVSLVYLMHKSFHQIAIHKPNTSRPANSERYLVCKWLRENTTPIRNYLFDVNMRMQTIKHRNWEREILELVPLTVLRKDEQFFNFVVESNNCLGERQILNLVKIRAFCQDLNLSELRQADMKKACLQFWQVPDRARTAPKYMSAEDRLSEMLPSSPPTFLSSPGADLTHEALAGLTLYDWRCLPLESSRDRQACNFYLGTSRGHTWCWERGRWHKCGRELQLLPSTLLYGELVHELRGESKHQVKLTALHVIDAMFLGGKDVRGLHLKERHEVIHKFCTALYRPTRHDLTRLRPKELFKLEDLDSLFSRLNHRGIKSQGGSRRLCFSLEDEEEERFFVANGVLFFKTTKEPWTLAYSRRSNSKYFFNTKTASSTFTCPREAITDFETGFERRLVWWWSDGVSLLATPPSPPPPSGGDRRAPPRVHRYQILERIQALLPHPN